MLRDSGPGYTKDMTSNTFLKGKTALITGGNRGIGFAIARALAEHGAKVGICGRNAQTVSECARELEKLSSGSWGAVCDVRSEPDQTAFFAAAKKQFEKLDICVPNAGEATLGSITQTSLADWNTNIESILTGTFLTMKAAILWMKETKTPGAILPVVSQAGKVGFELRAGYCAAKWGSLGLIECARMEAKKYGIRITSLLPASVATDFQAKNPMGTDWMMTADDIAEAALYALTASDRVDLNELWLRCWKKADKKDR